ncbi:hypothetical protein BH24ACT22_BH24ACT22_14480 [soil metagenome]
MLGNPTADARDWRKRFLIELWRTDYKALRTSKYKYIEHSTGARELYDLHRDPHELRSRHKTANPTLLKKLGEDLDRLRNCSTEECRSAEQR